MTVKWACMEGEAKHRGAETQRGCLISGKVILKQLNNGFPAPKRSLCPCVSVVIFLISSAHCDAV